MNKRERLAALMALMKSDGTILGLLSRWASLNRDIGLWDQRRPAAKPATGAAAEAARDPAPPGGDLERGTQPAGETDRLRADREECARQYNAREEALRKQVGL